MSDPEEQRELAADYFGTGRPGDERYPLDPELAEPDDEDQRDTDG